MMKGDDRENHLLKIASNRNSARHFTSSITKPDKPRLRTPFDDLLTNQDGIRISSHQEWRRKRRKILTAFRSTLGKSPKSKPDLQVREISRKRVRGFERRKIEIRVDMDEVVTAYLCLPHKPQPSRAAVLCLPYTQEYSHEIIAGLHGSQPEAYGARLAEKGFVTLCPNHFVMGERTPTEGAFVTAKFYRKYPHWSAVGKAVWDYQICLDYLQTLDEVDANRIGCMGHSLGAHSAVFLAALDERVRCIVSNCGWSSFRCNPNRCNWSRDGWYVYFPTLREVFLRGESAPFDMHELGAALAPRAWMDISSLSDPTFEGGEHLPGMFTRIHEVYRLERAAEKFAFYTHGEAHGVFEHSYVLAEAWLRRWL